MIHIRTGSLFFLTLCFWANGLGAESPSPLQELALEQVEQLSPRIKELAGRLWTLAETELEEHHSVQVLSRVLEAEGFAVEPNAGPAWPRPSWLPGERESRSSGCWPTTMLYPRLEMHPYRGQKPEKMEYPVATPVATTCWLQVQWLRP